ncbi:hypothetical protein RND71_025652 [Anisodus tanguticus]|uniref:Oxidation resistance protein 1 n=1 Tax=Anisodus tanguticus TaxID=243964 RepID=A0AAE1VAK7_9SOLA|nr:hypothetical protein RND71_025652 [Anisodus tanguticus]
MGSENHEQIQENLLHRRSLRSKAAHFVSDVATVIFNPISDKPLKPRPSLVPEDGSDSGGSKHEPNAEEDAKDLVDGPDTSSFSAFLYSLLSTSRPGSNSNTGSEYDKQDDRAESIPELTMKEPSRKKRILSRGKQSLGKAFHQVARLGGFRNQGSAKGSSEMVFDDGSNSKVGADDQIPLEDMNQKLLNNLPETSEPSVLLSEKARIALYASLPVLVQDRKWVLLYSTWRNGVSLSTLYRRSLLWSGISMLNLFELKKEQNPCLLSKSYFQKPSIDFWVRRHGFEKTKMIDHELDTPLKFDVCRGGARVVGDRNGAVFGGLVDAPLKPTTKRRYQGTNNSFVFSNVSGQPVIFRPTGEGWFSMSLSFVVCGIDGQKENSNSGVNRYFTVCSTEYLALGGGGHFALYLDGDLLTGSSATSETYGNSCLAHTEDFEVKEVEVVLQLYLLYGALYMLPSMKRWFPFCGRRLLEFAAGKHSFQLHAFQSK